MKYTKLLFLYYKIDKSLLNKKELTKICVTYHIYNAVLPIILCKLFNIAIKPSRLYPYNKTFLYKSQSL